MSAGLLSGLLGTQPVNPAGQSMQVVMIDRKNIVVNPDNRKIYVIGDVSRLKEDIKTNGIRQPLEVVDLEDGNYKLIGGERRLTACEELAKEGDDRFDVLPCIILQSRSPDDDKIALITANATARELTDGERLAQYEALKEILSRRKKNGELVGKVRDELCRILGLSAGAAARLNAIAENCDEKTKQQLRSGEISLMGAYRYAQAVIADKTAVIKMPDAVKENPKLFESKDETPVTLPKQEKIWTLHAQPDSIPDWAYAQVAAICSMDWMMELSEFTGKCICNSPKVKTFNATENKLDCGGYAYFTPTTVIVADEEKENDFELSWSAFVEQCKNVGILPKLTKKAPESDPATSTTSGKSAVDEQRGRKTLLALAEKELAQSCCWEFDRNLFVYQIDFYKHSLPGGATLYRMDDPQRDKAGLAQGEHTRYAIILQDYTFFTTGWENYVDTVESLIRYFELK